MNDVSGVQRHTYVPSRFIEFGAIYYKHAEEIVAPTLSEDRRIGVLNTLFSICAAVIEINDLAETPLKLEDVVTRVLDTLFRGQRDEVVHCLEAMEKVGLVTIAAEKRNTFKKRTCTFTPKYLFLMRAYTEDMCSVITGREVAFGNTNWIPVAQYLFDYMVFRYMPEWYLFLRRVLRSSGLPEEEKEELYDEIFSSALTWRTVMRYLAWAHALPPDERTRIAFRDHLKSVAADEHAEPSDLIRHLTRIGVCEVSNNLLLVNHKLAEDLAEFESASLRDYESFSDTIHAMLDRMRPAKLDTNVTYLNTEGRIGPPRR